jgi:hypothetical protein
LLIRDGAIINDVVVAIEQVDDTIGLLFALELFLGKGKRS